MAGAAGDSIRTWELTGDQGDITMVTAMVTIMDTVAVMAMDTVLAMRRPRGTMPTVMYITTAAQG